MTEPTDTDKLASITAQLYSRYLDAVAKGVEGLEEERLWRDLLYTADTAMPPPLHDGVNQAFEDYSERLREMAEEALQNLADDRADAAEDFDPYEY